MSEFLSGKRALVTGASKGIGLAVARALGSAGARVVICARGSKALEQALAELRKGSGGEVTGRTADVSNSDQVAQLFDFVDKQFGGLDILVNNAGIGVFRATRELNVEEWNRVIETNLSGAFYCSREALERFQKSGAGGSIINISSLAGKNPFAGGAAYNASKFGLNALSEAMMLDHRYDNVRVSYILPGSVDTAFSGHETEQRSDWKIAPEDIATAKELSRKSPRSRGAYNGSWKRARLTMKAVYKAVIVWHVSCSVLWRRQKVGSLGSGAGQSAERSLAE